MGYNSKELRVSKDPKKPSKPKDTDYVSKMGYRDDSPFRNQEAINIYTPNGIIDMSNTGIPLMANGRYLPPYSGQHQFDTTNVLEQRMASGGEVDADKAYSFLLAKSIYGHPLSAAQTKAFARIAGVRIDENGDIIEEGEEGYEGDEEAVSYDNEDTEDMSYEKRGGSTRGRKTSKNIKTSINKLLQRNAMLYGPSGKNLYDPNFKTGGWLDQYQPGGATATDSANVYNSAIQSKNFYDGLGKYYEKPKVDPKGMDQYIENVKSGKIQRETLAHEDVTEANKNIIRKNTNPNVQYFSDLVTGAIDPKAPLMMYDSRIKPDGTIEYFPKFHFYNVLQGKGVAMNNDDFARADLYFSRKGKDLGPKYKKAAENLAKTSGISMAVLQALSNNQEEAVSKTPGNFTKIPYYDPQEVKPWNLRTPEEKLAFAKKHPKQSTQTNKAKPNVSAKAPATVPVTKAVEEQVQASPLAWQPKTFKPTGPTKYQTVSGTGQKYYFANGKPVNENEYNTYYKNLPEIDRTTGLPIGQQPITKKQMGGWLDQYQPGGPKIDRSLMGEMSMPSETVQSQVPMSKYAAAEQAKVASKLAQEGHKENVYNRHQQREELKKKYPGKSDENIKLTQEKINNPWFNEPAGQLASYLTRFEGLSDDELASITGDGSMGNRLGLSAEMAAWAIGQRLGMGLIGKIPGASKYIGNSMVKGYGKAMDYFGKKAGLDAAQIALGQEMRTTLPGAAAELYHTAKYYRPWKKSLMPYMENIGNVMKTPFNQMLSKGSRSPVLEGVSTYNPLKNLGKANLHDASTALSASLGANHFMNTTGPQYVDMVENPNPQAAIKFARNLGSDLISVVPAFNTAATNLFAPGNWSGNDAIHKLERFFGSKLLKDPIKNEVKYTQKKKGGASNEWLPVDNYQYGGTVAELWQEVTGTPWKEAHERGLTDGSYEMNMQLRKLLLGQKAQVSVSHPAMLPANAVQAPVTKKVPAKVQKAPMPRIDPSLMGSPDYRSESVQSQSPLSKYASAEQNKAASKGYTKDEMVAMKKQWKKEEDAENLRKATVAAERELRIAKSYTARNKDTFGNPEWRSVLAEETGAIGDKLRVSNEENVFDDYINPAAWIGNMASNLGQSPLRAQQEDSYMPYLKAIGEPVVMGAIGKIASPYINKAVGYVAKPIVNAIPFSKNIGSALDKVPVAWDHVKKTFNEIPAALDERILKHFAKNKGVGAAFKVPTPLTEIEADLIQRSRILGSKMDKFDSYRPGYVEELKAKGYSKGQIKEVQRNELVKNLAENLKDNPGLTEGTSYEGTLKDLMAEYEALLKQPPIVPKNAPNPNYVPKPVGVPIINKVQKASDITQEFMENIKGLRKTEGMASFFGSNTGIKGAIEKNLIQPAIERKFMPLATADEHALMNTNTVMENLYGNQVSSPAREILKVMRDVEVQPKGFAFKGSGSLSADSYGMWTRAAENAIKKGQASPRFLGYNYLNTSGYPNQYGVGLESIEKLVNEEIANFNKNLSGKYKLPNAFIQSTKEGPKILYPDMGLIRNKYGGGQSMPYVHYKSGGWLDKYQTGKAVTPTDSLKHQAAKTMDYEYTKGSATGTGLSNYGNPALGPNPTKEQAVNWYMQNIAPKLGHFKTAMEKGEAGDFLYNSGKDARIYAYQEYLRKTDPQNKTGWQDASGNWKDRKVLPKDFDTIYDNSVGKLPENDRRIKVNQGRDWYYKNINNPSPGVPSPAYDATWHDRINEAVNTYQTGGPAWQDEGSKKLAEDYAQKLAYLKATTKVPKKISMDTSGFKKDETAQVLPSKYKVQEQAKVAGKLAQEGANEKIYNQHLQREELKKKYPFRSQEEIQTIQDKIESPLFYEPAGQLASYVTRFHGLTDDEIANSSSGDNTLGTRLGVAANMAGWGIANELGGKLIGKGLEYASPYIEKGLGYVGGKLAKYLPKKINPVVGEQLQRLEGLGPVPPPPTYEQYAASNLDPVTREAYERFNSAAQSSRTAAPVADSPMNTVLRERWGNQANLVDPNRTSPYYNNRQVEIPRNFATELEGDQWLQAMEHNTGNDSRGYMNRALTNKYGQDNGVIALQNQVRSQAITPLEGYNRIHNALRAESNNYHNWTTTAEASNPVSRPAASYKPEIASLKEVKNVDKGVIDKVEKYMQRPVVTTGYQNYDTASILGKVERVTSTNSIPKTAEIPDLITSFEKVYEKVKGKNTNLERNLRIQLEDLRGTNWLRTTGKAELEAQGLKPKELAIIDSGRGQVKNLVDKEGNIVGTITLSKSDSPIVSATGVNYKFHGYKLKDANAIKEAEAQLAERLLKDKATKEALVSQHNYDDPFVDNQEWSQGIYDELMMPEYSNLYKPEAEKTIAQLLDNNQNRYGDMLYRGVHHGIKDTRGPLESHAHFVQTTLPDAISNIPKTLYRGQNYWESGIKRGTHELTPNGALRVVRKKGGVLPQHQTIGQVPAWAPQQYNNVPSPSIHYMDNKPPYDPSYGIPKSGVVIDKRTNKAYYTGDKGEQGSFNVLTGNNPNLNKNVESLEYLDEHPNMRNTPRGYYLMHPQQPSTEYTQKHYKGMMRPFTPIPAFGMNAPQADNLAFHRVYAEDTNDPNDSEYNRRMRLINQSNAALRCGSYGCTNVTDESYNNVNQALPGLDTTLVIDSKNFNDLKKLQYIQENMKKNKKQGGWLDNH